LKCLKKASELDPSDPTVFQAVVEFYDSIAKETSLIEDVDFILKSESILEKPLDVYITEWASKSTTVYQIWMSWFILKSRDQQELAESILKKLSLKTPGFTLEVCQFFHSKTRSLRA